MKPVVNPRGFLRNLISWGASLFDLALIIPFFIASFLARFAQKNIDVGLGPEALINNIYHKKALERHGYSAETFVFRDNFISSEYDVNLQPNLLVLFFLQYWFFLRVLFRYRALFIYFNGGPLAKRPVLRPVEPIFYRIADVRVVVMPYGSDVQALERSKNLGFKHAMTQDYALHCKHSRRAAGNIQRWTKWADWVLSGCEWVDYMIYWDTLMLGHFSIDMDQWKSAADTSKENKNFRILHAPNHRHVKGTDALVQAVKILNHEGLPLDLVILSKVSNHEIREAMLSADLVADQFVIGWYAMFAIEAMSMEKPVLCYLRDDLLELYTNAGLLEKDEIPLINTPVSRIADNLRWAYHHRNELHEIGKRGRTFVARHHSLDSVGTVFASILSELGIRGSSR